MFRLAAALLPTLLLFWLLRNQKGLTKPNLALLSKAKGKAGLDHEARCLYLASMTT